MRQARRNPCMPCIIAAFPEAAHGSRTHQRHRRNASPTSKPAPPSCGGIFDFEDKAAAPRAKSPPSSKTRRSGTIRKRAQELGARTQGPRRRRLGPDRARHAGCATRRSSSRSRATESDDATLSAIDDDARKLEKTVADMEFRRMFSNPVDPNNCFLDIQAGSGGTEAQDWAAMLERMYTRYCERKGFEVEAARGVAGRSRRHQERDAQGDRRLRLRAAAHRDRRAPPRAQVAVRRQQPPPHVLRQRVRLPRGRRDDRDRRSIPPTCASTPSALPAPAASTSTRPTRRSASRTCRPTSSCNARTTARSTATAPRRWRCCKAKLYELELRKRKEEKQALEDTKTDIGWGHQIRSYVLDQSRIKDLRTDVEIGNTQAVLDGDLDDFIEASLKQGLCSEARSAACTANRRKADTIRGPATQRHEDENQVIAERRAKLKALRERGRRLSQRFLAPALRGASWSRSTSNADRDALDREPGRRSRSPGGSCSSASWARSPSPRSRT